MTTMQFQYKPKEIKEIEVSSSSKPLNEGEDFDMTHVTETAGDLLKKISNKKTTSTATKERSDVLNKAFQQALSNEEK